MGEGIESTSRGSGFNPQQQRERKRKIVKAHFNVSDAQLDEQGKSSFQRLTNTKLIWAIISLPPQRQEVEIM